MKLFVATLLIMAVISADAASLKVILISPRGELNVLLLEGKDILTVIIITTTSIIMINIVIITVITIIITMPKPAYGRQGLAGSWGQDTDQAGTFWGVLNVSLRACSAQLGFKPTWNH